MERMSEKKREYRIVINNRKYILTNHAASKMMLLSIMLKDFEEMEFLRNEEHKILYGNEEKRIVAVIDNITQRVITIYRRRNNKL